MALDSIHQKFLLSWKEFVTWVSQNVDSDYKFSIFGGALRDEIAGLSQYNDIDLYIGESDFALPKSYIGACILDYLPNNKIKILNLDKFNGSFKFEPTMYGNNLEKDSFTFEVEDIETKERASIKVDFVRSTEKLECPAPNYSYNLDADVNSLYYHNGEIKTTLSHTNVAAIMLNIKNGYYNKTISCKFARNKKLKIWAEKVASFKAFGNKGDNKTEIALEAAKAQGLEVKNLLSKDIDLSGYLSKKEENVKITREEIIEAIRAKKFADFSFEGKDLSGQNLSGLNFWGKNFKGANLKGANLSRSCLEGVDFQGANLEGVNFNQAIFDKNSIWAEIPKLSLARAISYGLFL